MLRALAVAASAAILASLAATQAEAEQVTILLALEPSKVEGESWDVGRGADMVLCTREGCYRSGGHERPARFLPGKRALSPLAAISLGGKAGACTNELACAFRGVDLGGSASYLEPVDVDVDRHDRLEHRIVSADKSCAIRKGALGCYRGVYTREYSMWVVPEALAEEAGPEAIGHALEKSLAEARLTYAEEFLSEERQALPGLAAGFYRLVLGEDIAERCARRFDVLSEAFALSGALSRDDDEVAGLLVDYLDTPDEESLLNSIRTWPRAFWRLHDGVNRLNAITSAEAVRHDDRHPGIAMEEGTLVVGIDALDRARALIDRCEGRDETDLSSVAKPKKS